MCIQFDFHFSGRSAFLCMRCFACIMMHSALHCAEESTVAKYALSRTEECASRCSCMCVCVCAFVFITLVMHIMHWLYRVLVICAREYACMCVFVISYPKFQATVPCVVCSSGTNYTSVCMHRVFHGL